MSQTPRPSFCFDVYIGEEYHSSYSVYMVPDRNQNQPAYEFVAEDFEVDPEESFYSPEIQHSPDQHWSLGLTRADLEQIDEEEFRNDTVIVPLSGDQPWLPEQSLFAEEEILPTQILSDSEPEILFKDTTGDINLSDLFE